MSIAVNANPTTFSVRRSGRQIKLTTQLEFRSSERRRTFSLFRAINISPLRGEERSNLGHANQERGKEQIVRLLSGGSLY